MSDRARGRPRGFLALLWLAGFLLAGAIAFGIPMVRCPSIHIYDVFDAGNRIVPWGCAVCDGTERVTLWVRWTTPVRLAAP